MKSKRMESYFLVCHSNSLDQLHDFFTSVVEARA